MTLWLMARRKPSLWRLIPVVLVVATGLVLVAGGGASFALHPKSAQAGANVALMSLGVGVLTLGPFILKMFRWSMKHSAAVPTASIQERVRNARDSLATELRAQWEKEIVFRKLDDPDALTVYWRLSRRPVMDHAKNIFRPDQLAPDNICFSGQTDESIEAMAVWFRSLIKRRLVILGDAGMGKTTLAILLMFGLLDSERERLDSAERGRIPVLFTLSGWHDGNELGEWLGQRLGETYPNLRANDPDLPGELVKQGKILPILDGLDELDELLRPRLLAQVVAHHDPLILTCRTDEYLATVTGPDGKVLTGAAVIEPMPLQAAEIAEYLERVVPRARRDEWLGLFLTLRRRPEHPITQALATPLNVWLLRKTYLDTRMNPTGLLDTGRYRTQSDITNHLLDGLILALFGATARPSSADGKNPFLPRRSREPADVSRWLAFLAQHVQAADGQDLAWWHLNRSVANYRQSIIARVVSKTRPRYGLVFGLGLGLLIMLADYAAGIHGPGLVYTLAWLLAVTVAGGMLGRARRIRKSITRAVSNFIDAVANLKTVPSYLNFGLSLRGHLRFWLSIGLSFLLTAFLMGLLIGLSLAIPFALMGALMWWHGPPFPWRVIGLAPWILRCFLIGFGGFFVAGFLSMSMNLVTDFAATPQTGDQPQTPAITLHSDLQLTRIRWLTVGLPFGLAAGPFVAVTALTYGLRGAIVVGILLILAPAIWGLYWVRDRASVGYLVTVAVLRLERQVPWRLMAFLDDAYRVGLLRQVGAMYQFRHIMLTDYFARPSPQSLITRYAAAFSQARRVDLAAAITVLKDQLADQLRVLGRDHPDTLTTRREIARMMTGRGDHAAALAEYRDVLAAELRVLGRDHPDTLTTRREIARMMTGRGDHAALAEYRDVLAAELRVLGPDHPSTLATRHEIARMITERGDHAALAEYRDVLAAELRVLGPDHPSTLASSTMVHYLEAHRNG